MRILITTCLLALSFTGNSQTAGILLARTYAKDALIKIHDRENIKDINVEIIDWNYNSSTDRFYVYFKATFKSWDMIMWFSNNVKTQLKCNLDGTAAQIKYDGMFESWQDIGSIR